MADIELTLLSNTEKKVKADKIPKFKDWLRKKGYLKRDCWCKHIDTFNEEVGD